MVVLGPSIAKLRFTASYAIASISKRLELLRVQDLFMFWAKTRPTSTKTE